MAERHRRGLVVARGKLSQTVAASLTVLIGMLLLGLFIALGTWTLAWSNHVKRELAVHVYFQSNATRSDENALLRRLQVNPYVKAGGIRFISKEAAFRQVAREAPDLTEALPFNPLGDTFELTPTKPEDVDRLYDSLVRPGLPHVHNVSDGRQVSHRILQVAHIVEAIFFAAAFALVAASVLLISNTIRLSVFSRRREIEVMKLVGATNWHVRAPFMVEGVLCGLIGSLVAVVLLLLGRVFLLPTIVPSLSGDADVHALGFPLTALLLLAMGLGVSALGSGLTLRRFLRV